MNQNFTDAVTSAIQIAFAEAQNRSNPEVSDNHLLWSEERVGLFCKILKVTFKQH